MNCIDNKNSQLIPIRLLRVKCITAGAIENSFIMFIYKFYIFTLLSCLIWGSTEYDEPSMMQEYFKLTPSKDKRYEINYTDFLIFSTKYYQTNPVSCLEELYSMKDCGLDTLFFFNRSNGGCLTIFPRVHIPNYLESKQVCKNIKWMVINLFLEPFRSTSGMEKTFSVINQLIRFIERHAKYIMPISSFSPDLMNELDHVEAWKFVMKSYSSYWPNGTIDFLHHIFPILNFLIKPVIRNKDHIGYMNYLLLITCLNHIIKEKDFRIFEFNHPELPFLIGFMLDHIYSSGNSMFGNSESGSSLIYHQKLQKYFGSAEKISNLNKIMDKRIGKIIQSNSPIKYENYRSFPKVLEKLRKRLPESLNRQQRNLLWQMECVYYIERFLKKSTCHVQNAPS
jgi:hypothetical protein